MNTPQHGDRIGSYEVEGMLGRGGMSSVFSVRHVDLGTRHAMKVPSGSSSRQLAQRLLQEGRMQAQLRHPHVVNVSDVVRTGDDVVLVMDLVEGVDLEELVVRGPLTEAQVDSIAAALFDAVEAAHALGLVHRDLKPSNVLLEVTGATLVPRVADFGLAKALSEGLRVARATRKGALMGTPQFMAPEQFRDASSVDTRADLYSLGGVLYTMIAGRSPFPPGIDVVEQMKATLSGGWEPLDRVAPGTPARWVEAVHACLQLDRDARPATVGVLRRMWQPRAHATGSVWPARRLAELRGDASVPPAERRTVVVPPQDSGTLHREPPTAVPPPRSKVRWARAVVALGGLMGAGLVALGAAVSALFLAATLLG